MTEAEALKAGKLVEQLALLRQFRAVENKDVAARVRVNNAMPTENFVPVSASFANAFLDSVIAEVTAELDALGVTVETPEVSA